MKLLEKNDLMVVATFHEVMKLHQTIDRPFRDINMLRFTVCIEDQLCLSFSEKSKNVIVWWLVC